MHQVSQSCMQIVERAKQVTAAAEAVSIANTSTTARTVTIAGQHFAAGKRYYWYSLEGGDDNGEFSRRVFINGHGPAAAAGGPDDYTGIEARSATAAGGIVVTIPPRGAVFLTVDKR